MYYNVQQELGGDGEYIDPAVALYPNLKNPWMEEHHLRGSGKTTTHFKCGDKLSDANGGELRKAYSRFHNVLAPLKHVDLDSISINGQSAVTLATDAGNFLDDFTGPLLELAEQMDQKANIFGGSVIAELRKDVDSLKGLLGPDKGVPTGGDDHSFSPCEALLEEKLTKRARDMTNKVLTDKSLFMFHNAVNARVCKPVPKVCTPAVPGICTPGICTPGACTPEVCTPKVCTPEVCTGGSWGVPRVCPPKMCTPRVCTPKKCLPQACLPEVCTGGIAEVCVGGTAEKCTDGVMEGFDAFVGTLQLLKEGCNALLAHYPQTYQKNLAHCPSEK